MAWNVAIEEWFLGARGKPVERTGSVSTCSGARAADGRAGAEVGVNTGVQDGGVTLYGGGGGAG